MSEKQLNLVLVLLCGLLMFVLLGLPSSSFAQCQCLSGTITDQHDKTPLYNAVVSVIYAKDSVLTKFGRSDIKGHFNIKVPDTGRYTMMVSYPGYADLIDRFAVTKDSSVSMGAIGLIKKSELLESVIVKQQLGAIRIKGDTIEYKADSFLMNKGATVSDLLKRLPGIQVDRKGNITAQGQKVNKVLVDGEEFFSDDPAVVTQNLGADYVKDVQVYDKKSDQAEFTGIDDGQRSRTINLKLKPDKKKGYFGKLNLGGGTGGKFDNALLLNSFKGSRKISVFGIMANTDHNMLSWSEMNKLGTAGSPEYDEENGYFTMSNNIDDDFSQEIYSDEGLPTTWTGGIHYSDAWGDKQKMSGDYRFMKRNLSSSSTTTTQFILPDTQYFNSQSRKAFTTRIRNNLSGVYDLKIDSNTSVRLSVLGGRVNANTAAYYTSKALNSDSMLVNDNSRTLISDLVKDNFALSALLRKKFKKKGRTLSWSLDESNTRETLDGSLISRTDYFSSFNGHREELINQKKINNSNTGYLLSKIVYTEPLSKNVFLSFNYGISSNLNNSHRNTFNKDTTGGYFKFRDSLYSNDFKYSYLTQSGGADVKINTKKLLYSFGGTGGYTKFLQRDLVKDSASRYSFLNFYPRALIKYTISSQRKLSLRYSGITNSPEISQLQPVRQNTDPLNIQLGNPSLRQQFRHSLNVDFFDYRVLTNRSLYAFAYVDLLQNAISMSSTVDSVGKTTYRYVNLNGNRNGGTSFGYNAKSKKFDLYLGAGGELQLGHLVSQINGMANVNDNQTYLLQLSVGKSVEKKYSFELRPSLGYTFSKSSLRPDVVTRYFTTETNISVWVQLPWKLSVSSNAYINTRQKTQVFDVNQNVVKWDANLKKTFGKNEKAELTFNINDILNQNIGFNRSATSNFISQNTYSTLRRFAMLSFVYNISKNP